MVYRLEMNIGINIGKILSSLADSGIFDIFYNGRTLLIAYKTYVAFKERNFDFIKDFEDYKNCIIAEINIEEVNNYPQEEREWIMRKLVRLDTEKFEYENQEDMKKYMTMLEELDRDLQREVDKKNKRVKNINFNKKRKRGAKEIWQFWKKKKE